MRTYCNSRPGTVPLACVPRFWRGGKAPEAGEKGGWSPPPTRDYSSLKRRRKLLRLFSSSLEADLAVSSTASSLTSVGGGWLGPLGNQPAPEEPTPYEAKDVGPVDGRRRRKTSRHDADQYGQPPYDNLLVVHLYSLPGVRAVVLLQSQGRRKSSLECNSPP